MRWQWVVISDAYGGFAKGMPKNLVNVPLAEPTKFFGVEGASIFIKQRPQGSVTDRIVQPDHWSLVAYTKGRTAKGKRE
jgi:hypothetical protein